MFHTISVFGTKENNLKYSSDKRLNGLHTAMKRKIVNFTGADIILVTHLPTDLPQS
jgi:hypothetical protein